MDYLLHELTVGGECIVCAIVSHHFATIFVNHLLVKKLVYLNFFQFCN